MWKSDEDLIGILRAGRRTQLNLEEEIASLESDISRRRSSLNNLNTQMTWANKYLIHDLTGTRWEHDLEGWLAQRG
jgi:hypothetical protein